MAIDWSNVQDKAGGNFKSYYADGDYKVKCDGVEIKEAGQNGNYVMKFHFEEDEKGQFPTADHWITFKEGKDAWRQWHNKCLIVVLGATDDAAKKAVEMAESKSGKDNIVKAYEQVYKKLLAKKPEVEIEVYTENKYARAEFKDRTVAMPHDSESAKENYNDDPLAGSEDASEEIELDSLPF